MEGSGWRTSSGAAGAKGLGQEQLAQLLSGLPAPPGNPWFFFQAGKVPAPGAVSIRVPICLLA